MWGGGGKFCLVCPVFSFTSPTSLNSQFSAMHPTCSLSPHYLVCIYCLCLCVQCHVICVSCVLLASWCFQTYLQLCGSSFPSSLFVFGCCLYPCIKDHVEFDSFLHCLAFGSVSVWCSAETCLIISSETGLHLDF